MELKNIIILILSILIIIVSLSNNIKEDFSNLYNWKKSSVSCDTDRIYINANSNNYSITNENEYECQKNCGEQEKCEMYLMSSDNTCHLYDNVSNVTEYCSPDSSGPSHKYWGKIKSNCSDCQHIDGSEDKNYTISMENPKLILGTVTSKNHNFQPSLSNENNPYYNTVYLYTSKGGHTKDGKFINEDIDFHSNWKIISFQFKYFLIQNVFTGRFLSYGNLNKNSNKTKIVYLTDNNLDFSNLWLIKKTDCNTYNITPYSDSDIYLKTTIPISNNFVDKNKNDIDYEKYGQVTTSKTEFKWNIKLSENSVSNITNSEYNFNQLSKPSWIFNESKDKWYSLYKSKMIGNWGVTNVISNSNMTVSFWINIPTLNSNWTSILHITNDNQNCCDNGRRVPGLWLWPNSTKLYLSVGLENGEGNFIVPPTNNENTSPEIGINKPTFVVFTFNGQQISLYLNGVLNYIYNCPSKLTKSSSNASFYCPSPWYKSSSSSEQSFVKNPGAKNCDQTTMVTNENDCRSAASYLKMPFAKVVDQDENAFGVGRPAGCFWDQDGSIYFNKNLDSSSSWGGVGGVCKEINDSEILNVYTAIKNLCLYDKSLSSNEIFNSYKLQKNNYISSWVLPCTYNWYSLNNGGQNMGKWAISKIIPSSNYMSFSFWINIPKINSSNWTSIFHISNQNINCCNVGNRVPAVWLHPNSTQLLVVNDQINKGNTSISSKNYIGLNNYTYITITIETKKISIYFNGKLDNSKTFSDTLQPATSDAYFYSPDIWYPSKDIYSQIKDLTFYNSIFDQKQVNDLYNLNKKEIEYKSEYNSSWTLENTKNKWYKLNNSNLIGNWGETKIVSSNNMNICFWIKVSKLNSNWSSILHITNQNVNCCNVGNRVPALWLYPNSTKLLVVTDSQNQGNTFTNSDTDIKLDTETFISININTNKVEIYFNGVLNKSYTYPSNLEKANDNAYFYCPDPWYNPEQSGVSIKNLTFYNSSLTEKKIKKLYQERNISKIEDNKNNSVFVPYGNRYCKSYDSYQRHKKKNLEDCENKCGENCNAIALGADCVTYNNCKISDNDKKQSWGYDYYLKKI